MRLEIVIGVFIVLLKWVIIIAVIGGIVTLGGTAQWYKDIVAASPSAQKEWK